MEPTTPTTQEARPASKGGSKALGAGVTMLTVMYVAILPAVLVGLIYLFISVYAIVKISPPGHPNPTVVLVGVVLLVGLMTVLLGVSIFLIGKAFDPPKRH